MIAGFELPDCGPRPARRRDVTGRAPYERDVNTVFQDYALFPHMTVQENVEYGLRGQARAAGRARAARARRRSRWCGSPASASASPAQLSGGQRQRVALARALVNRPRVLLLDEPLGALDLKLRQEMQIELKQIQQSVGITFIYVTHDQEEALTMSDRIAVFNDGRIEQVGTPAEVYERPATPFVAGFVGTSNLLRRRSRGSAASHALRVGPTARAARRLRRADRRAHDRRAAGEDPTAAAGGACEGSVTCGGTITRGGLPRHGDALRGRGRRRAGSVVVLEQNLDTTSMEALGAQGRAVRLTWQPRAHVRHR